MVPAGKRDAGDPELLRSVDGSPGGSRVAMLKGSVRANGGTDEHHVDTPNGAVPLEPGPDFFYAVLDASRWLSVDPVKTRICRVESGFLPLLPRTAFILALRGFQFARRTRTILCDCQYISYYIGILDDHTSAGIVERRRRYNDVVPIICQPFVEDPDSFLGPAFLVCQQQIGLSRLQCAVCDAMIQAVVYGIETRKMGTWMVGGIGFCRDCCGREIRRKESENGEEIDEIHLAGIGCCRPRPWARRANYICGGK